ncbi:MAG: type II toxin-antitoxin system RelE/ParE family toxin [Burkholderiaceae bacterium]|jgi:putative addiction module killer protein|nr:type II toxin-antitoxin system RelE/ParE family toxin [Burkholderiaceae bacterium]
MNYIIRQTEAFAAWRAAMRDMVAATAIRRMELGNFGDVKSVGEGVSEARVDVGAGYRLYFTVRDLSVVFLLRGGDKSTQDADIKAAKKLAKEL